MIKGLFDKPPRWRKIPREDRCRAEAFLREREKLCVTASARFLHLDKNHGHVWRLDGPGGEISALLLHSRQLLFPLFDKNPRVPGPRFLNRFLRKVHIHAVQGLREDVEILEALMEQQGYFPAERIDYVLMGLDSAPLDSAFRAGPEDLVLREPAAGDEKQLFGLQSAYEQEEVLTKNSNFNPAACRLNLEHILSTERILAAELDGQLIGKINTSAESFTRYQIGGVYVRPDCRGLGIGTKMTAVFSQALLAQGRGLSLFVKRRNAAAIKIYRKAGFSVLADYRISYY